MNPTTPERLTTAGVAPCIDGIRRPAPQPMGTWFSRWHHLYTQAPTPVAAADDSTVTPLPRPSQLTTAA